MTRIGLLLAALCISTPALGKTAAAHFQALSTP